MFIDASDVNEDLIVICDTDCYDSTIICPENHKNCNIDCSQVDGTRDCQNIDIYSKYGYNGVKLSYFYYLFCLFWQIISFAKKKLFCFWT